MTYIRIVAVPPGEAPDEIRQAWVGLTLPLLPGYEGQRTWQVGGVLSSDRTLLGRLFSRRVYTGGYAVCARAAFDILQRERPWAASWWRENTPHLFRPYAALVFATEACREEP